MRKILTILALSLFFLTPWNAVAQCDVNNFTVTPTNGDCFANASITVQVPGALNCTNWIAILTAPDGSENSITIPANGGPISFISLQAGSYNVRLFDGATPVPSPDNPIVLTTTYQEMSISNTMAAPTCNPSGTFYTPDGTLDISIDSGGTGPFVYEVTSSVGTQTFGPTPNRTHTFGNMPANEQVDFTVTDQVNGQAGCEVSQSQQPIIPASNASSGLRAPILRRQCAPNCNGYLFYQSVTVSNATNSERVAILDALQDPGNATISINGNPAVDLVVEDVNFNTIRFRSPSVMNEGDTVTANYNNGCDAFDTGTLTAPPVQDTYPRVRDASIISAFDTVSCTPTYELGGLVFGTTIGGVQVGMLCDTHTVVLEQEFPAGSGTYVNVPLNPDPGPNPFADVLGPFGGSLDVELPGPGNYRLTTSDSCHSYSDDFTVDPLMPGSDLDELDIAELPSMLEGTGGFQLFRPFGSSVNLTYPITVEIARTDGQSSVTMTPGDPGSYAGTYTVNFPSPSLEVEIGVIAGATNRVAAIGDLPPGEYRVNVRDACGNRRTSDFIIPISATATYNTVIDVEDGCDNSSVINYDLGPVNPNVDTSNTYQDTRLFTDDGTGNPGTLVNGGISGNTVSGSFGNIAPGDYLLNFRTGFGRFLFGGPELDYSAAFNELNTGAEFNIPVTVLPVDNVTIDTDVFNCDPTNNAVQIIVTSSPIIYPLTYEIFDPMDLNTPLHTFTAADATSPSATSHTFDGIPNGDYVARATTLCSRVDNNVSVTSEPLPDVVSSNGIHFCPDTASTVLSIALANSIWDISWTDDIGNPLGTNVSSITVAPTLTTTYTVTFQLNSASGCTSSFVNTRMITITVDDTIFPTASDPLDIDVQCIGDVPAPDITVVTDEADNCSATADISVAFVSDSAPAGSNPGTITRTYSVTDQAGNSINVAQTITVDDTIFPTASDPLPVNVQCIGDVPAPDITVVTDEADNCSATADIAVAFVSDSALAGSNPGTITRTYSVTDQAGNSINVAQTITVDDTIFPTASDPLPVNVQCIGDVPAPDITVVTDEADNCSATADISVAFVSDSPLAGSNPGTITRTYSVTDQAGNSINVAQTITVDDTIFPTASDPLPVNVQCIGDVPAPDITVVTDEADNCSATADIAVAFVSDSALAGSNPGTITRTYSVTDQAGNSINVAQTITVDDTIFPTASDPLPVNVQCIGDVPAPDITVVTDEADNCSATADISVAFVSDSPLAGSNPGTITRTYSVTDQAGNSINVAQTITVDDTIFPTASDPLPVNVQCIGDVPAPDITVVTDEADNCSATADIAVAFVSDSALAGSNPGTITRTYSVTDQAGNSINVAQTITVDDTIFPTASDPLPVNVQCIGDVPAPDITVVTDEADNCSATADISVAFVSDSAPAGSNPGTITRTYSVTDQAGNSINVAQTITVDDTIFPTASDPLPVNVQCIGDVPAPDITVVTDEADNCSATADIAVAFVSDSALAGSNPGTITRTYSVTDQAGNSINVAQTITVDDTIFPTASDPLPVNVQCIGDVPAPDITVVTDEADNCSATADIAVAFVSDSALAGSNPGTITRTYSVTDQAGNSINVAQTITVDDTIFPTASDPLPVNVQCIGDVPAPDITVVTDEADNCSATADIAVAFVSDSPLAGSNPGTITRTYSVTDQAGNSINVAQTITVDDTIFPTASDPLPVNVQCIGDVPAPDITVVTDEADNCSATADIAVAFVSDSALAGSNPGTITRTYSVTDQAGNSINVAQTITVDDTIFPTASDPLPVNVQCIGDVPAPDITVVTDEADNCSATADISVAFVSDSAPAGSNPGTITRTYSVTDQAGNSINVAQTITVDDTIFPTASDPLPVNVQCIGDVPAPDITVVTDEADNCSATADIAVAFVSDSALAGSNPGTITRTYSVTDQAGNSINVAQTITVDDTIFPTASDPLPVNVQCIGDVPAPDITVVTDEADNCSATADLHLRRICKRQPTGGKQPGHHHKDLQRNGPGREQHQRCTDHNRRRYHIPNRK